MLLAVAADATIFHLAHCHAFGEEEGDERVDVAVVNTILDFPESAMN